MFNRAFFPRSHPRDTSEVMKFDHVYECPRCKHLWLGFELHKNKEGKRPCKDCVVFFVEDVTFTEQGAVFLAFAGKIDRPF